LSAVGYKALNKFPIAKNKVSSAQPWEQYVFKQDYTYDQWGNRTLSFSDAPGAFNQPFNIDAATNRLLAPNGTIGYDFDGNQTTDSYSGGGSRSYDAENRMLTAQGHSYTYDADGRRVRRAISGGQTYWQVFGVAGEMVAEYTANAAPSTPTKEYGYRGGQLLVTTDGGRVKWLVGDHLGTPRMVVDQSGDLTGANQVIRHDYLPFGEEILAGTGIRATSNGYAGDGIRQKFTGKDRDAETGLDYFEARYYAGKQGRFTSPDEFSGGPDDLFDFADVASENPTLYGDLTEPQSLNKYVYCYNNPLSFIDIDGHKTWGQWLKTGLEVASYIPGPIGTAASVVQVGVALAQGDYKGAASAAMGVVPGGKIIAKAGAAVATVAVAAVVVSKVAKTADKADDAGKVVSKLASGGAEGIVNRGGRFADLNKAKKAGEVAHHTPQAAAGVTSRADGPAIGMTKVDHEKTRTFRGKGIRTKREDADLSPRERLAKAVTQNNLSNFQVTATIPLW
jgi:RHS repeat-associated protein